MALSNAFPHQPGTNGVCERFFRSLNEQAIFDRIFRTTADVRLAASEFVARYNASGTSPGSASAARSTIGATLSLQRICEMAA